jgi:hypothetical protein
MSEQTETREPIVSEWGGFPNYECPIVLANGKRCEFATLEADLIAAHLDPRWGPHKETEAAAPVIQPLSDDERAELLALREEVPQLKTALSTTKGQLTRATNKLAKLDDASDAPPSEPVGDDDADDTDDDTEAEGA